LLDSFERLCVGHLRQRLGEKERLRKNWQQLTCACWRSCRH
jgi:hypothetical protein